MTNHDKQPIDEGAMQKMSVAPPDEGTAPAVQEEVAELDYELDETVDASDPPSATQPGGRTPADESEAHPS